MKLKLNFLIIITALLNIGFINNEISPGVDHDIEESDVIITIDALNQKHSIPKNPDGVVSCWQMDSDIERPRKISFSDAIIDMDFDEYISICDKVGAEPMVVVNILSYKYKNGPLDESPILSARKQIQTQPGEVSLELKPDS